MLKFFAGKVIILAAVILSLAACGSSSSTPAAGTPANPIVIPANPADNQFSEIYNGTVGTDAVYFKMIGLIASNNYGITLTNLTADADLYVYSDAFTTLASQSTNTGTAMESCFADTNAQGELYIKVDGSKTASGSSFTLQAGT